MNNRQKYNPLSNNFDYAYSDSDIREELERLDYEKADISSLHENISLYATTASSDVVWYNRLVTSIEDTDYNTTAVDVPVPATWSLDVSSSDDWVNTELVGALISDEGLFIWNPWVINIPTIGNIRRQNDSDDQWNQNNYARFYFKVFKRDWGWVETLVATSSHTPAVQDFNRPAWGYVYESFNAFALLNDGEWTSSDRIVVKYYADTLLCDTNKVAYEFQFWGNQPVRTELPVPTSVVVHESPASIFRQKFEWWTDFNTWDSVLTLSEYPPSNVMPFVYRDGIILVSPNDYSISWKEVSFVSSLYDNEIINVTWVLSQNKEYIDHPTPAVWTNDITTWVNSWVLPNSSWIFLYRQGVLITETNDYTVSWNTITLVSPVVTSDLFTLVLKY